MALAELDTAAIARCLALLAEQAGDHADAYFERREEVEIASGDEVPGPRAWREEGFAVRLLRGGRAWMVSRDGCDAGGLAEALRRVARSLPRTGFHVPALRLAPFPESDLAEMAAFPAAIARHVREHHVAFPLRLRLRRHRNWRQVIGSRLMAEQQHESFYSVAADMPWASHAALLPRLDEQAAEAVARSLVARFRCRDAAPPGPHRGVTVLGPAAAAVLLHEAVAHALETDTLALTGDPEAAVGLRMSSAALDVLDDPAAAPETVRRSVDDEGVPVVRRWLLRGGVVEQPLADTLAAARSGVLTPGAARRSDRHAAPAPRSTHLEVLSGECADEDLLAAAEGGLYLPEASRGHLDPLSGRFRLAAPYSRRLEAQGLGERLGPCALSGRVADLLGAVTAVGATPVAAGAGWCAKGGQRLAVWATTPGLRLEGVEVGE